MFKVNREVVCVDDSSFCSTKDLVKGNVYTIKNIVVCPGCGKQSLVLKELSDWFSKTGCRCCGSIIIEGVHCFDATRFRPVQRNLISNKDLISNIIEEKLDVPIKIHEKELENA